MSRKIKRRCSTLGEKGVAAILLKAVNINYEQDSLRSCKKALLDLASYLRPIKTALNYTALSHIPIDIDGWKTLVKRIQMLSQIGEICDREFKPRLTNILYNHNSTTPEHFVAAFYNFSEIFSSKPPGKLVNSIREMGIEPSEYIDLKNLIQRLVDELKRVKGEQKTANDTLSQIEPILKNLKCARNFQRFMKHFKTHFTTNPAAVTARQNIIHRCIFDEEKRRLLRLTNLVKQFISLKDEKECNLKSNLTRPWTTLKGLLIYNSTSTRNIDKTLKTFASGSEKYQLLDAITALTQATNETQATDYYKLYIPSVWTHRNKTSDLSEHDHEVLHYLSQMSYASSSDVQTLAKKKKLSPPEAVYLAGVTRIGRTAYRIPPRSEIYADCIWCFYIAHDDGRIQKANEILKHAWPQLHFDDRIERFCDQFHQMYDLIGIMYGNSDLAGTDYLLRRPPTTEDYIKFVEEIGAVSKAACVAQIIFRMFIPNVNVTFTSTSAESS